MTATYTTIAGDMLDAICYNYYGTTLSGQVEAVLSSPANQSLDLGSFTVLPAGLVIHLPVLSETPKQSVQLYS